MKKIKLLFFIYTITDYQLIFFKFLKKLNFLDVEILFYDEVYKNYNFTYVKKKYFNFLKNYSEPEKQIKKKIITFYPDFVILGGYKFPNNAFIIKILKEQNIKYFYWLERLDKKRIIKNNILHFFIKKRLKNANGIISIGKEAKEFYKKYNRKVYNLPYSIKANKKYKKNFFKNKKINFLFVGQLIKRKGADLLFNVLEKFDHSLDDKINFTIVGNGQYEKHYKSLSEKRKNIKFFNFQNFNKLKEIYLKNDVLIFPSRFDGWGVVPMEAMSYSLFLIISRNCGVIEILNNSKGNYIIECNEKDIKAAIIRCLLNKQNIKSQAMLNKRLISNSICNNKNLVKTIKKVFNIK